MSSTEQTLQQLTLLRLGAMAQTYAMQREQPALTEIGFDDRFGQLVEAEVSARQSRKLKRLIRRANLSQPAALEDLDVRAARGLDKGQIAALATCDWVRRQQNLFILGATGVGKTWLASALATQACRLELSVLSYRFTDLCTDIETALADGSLARCKAALIKPALLVIDDFGLGSFSTRVGEVLLDVVDRRLPNGALLITSQYGSDQWHGGFADPTVADAFLDRIVHNAHRIELKGESMRKLKAKTKMATA